MQHLSISTFYPQIDFDGCWSSDSSASLKKKAGVGPEKRKHSLTLFMRYTFTYECHLKSLFPCANNRLTGRRGLKIKKYCIESHYVCVFTLNSNHKPCSFVTPHFARFQVSLCLFLGNISLQWRAAMFSLHSLVKKTRVSVHHLAQKYTPNQKQET